MYVICSRDPVKIACFRVILGGSPRSVKLFQKRLWPPYLGRFPLFFMVFNILVSECKIAKKEGRRPNSTYFCHFFILFQKRSKSVVFQENAHFCVFGEINTTICEQKR